MLEAYRGQCEEGGLAQRATYPTPPTLLGSCVVFSLYFVFIHCLGFSWFCCSIA